MAHTICHMPPCQGGKTNKNTRGGLWQSKFPARFLRYTAVGFLALIINFALVGLMNYFFHMDYLLACSFAFLIETGIVFWVHRKWTFGIHTNFRRGYTRSLIIGLWGLAIILVCTYIGMHFLALHYVWARTASGMIAGLATYAIELRLIFSAAS